MPLPSYSINWRWHVLLHNIFSCSVPDNGTYITAKTFLAKVFWRPWIKFWVRTSWIRIWESSLKTFMLEFFGLLQCDVLGNGRYRWYYTSKKVWILNPFHTQLNDLQTFHDMFPSYYIILCTSRTCSRCAHVFLCVHIFNFLKLFCIYPSQINHFTTVPFWRDETVMW